MHLRPLALSGVMLLEPRLHSDERGCFFEAYRETWMEAVGLPTRYVQDNQSRSQRHVLRGLHWQRPGAAQDKLVRVIAGSIYDVVVDLRRSSPTWGQHLGVVLSAQNRQQLFVPSGFAHGFLSCEEGSEVLYKCSHGYDPSNERGVAWNDPHLGIAWPLPAAVAPRVHARDAGFPMLCEVPIADLFP